MPVDRATRELRIVVASLTRKRPHMLSSLLQSWGRMELPENCEVSCLIVENDTKEVSRAVVEAHQFLRNGVTLDYVVEPELGIPFGRNRAAKEAIQQRADLLVFVDDDETVAPDWLKQLVMGYRKGRAVLLGAPVRAKPPRARLTLFQRIMFRNIRDRCKRKERWARRRASLNDAPRVTVITNNWIGETRLFSEHGIWFDEEMRFTGGTDSKFCAAVKEKGLAVGWVSDALVYETIPKQRLSFVYQYRRSRDQANTHLRRKVEQDPMKRWSVLLHLPFKACFVVVLLIGVPLTGGQTLLSLARTSGFIAGRVGVSFGKHSRLYSSVTGNTLL